MALSDIIEREFSNTRILSPSRLNRLHGKNKCGLVLSFFMTILLINLKSIIAMNVGQEMIKYCRVKDRLIASEDIDESLLIDGELNTTILLECHFCNEKCNEQPKIWYWQDRYQSSQEKEVEIGMDNNISLNRIHVTPELSLVIKDLNQNDAGIYRCHGKEGQEAEKKFNYKLEPVYKDESIETVEKGNLSDWQKYHETNLVPVTMRFAVSRMMEVALIREAGILLELVSEWGPWSPCENCKFGKGYKNSRAYCRIKRKINETLAKGQDKTIINFFRKSPLLPCRSIILENYPGIISATRYLPEFILEEKCKKCKKVKKFKPHKFKYRKKYVLAEGAHISIYCPESSLETQVVWRKDGFLLEKGKGLSFRKKDPEPRVLVDTFSTLYLREVSEVEGGNYACYVNNIKMMQVKIVVVSKSRLLNEAFLRHLVYLGFILLLSSFCYCAGLVMVFQRRDKFKLKDYKEIEAQKQEKNPLFDLND